MRREFLLAISTVVGAATVLIAAPARADGPRIGLGTNTVEPGQQLLIDGDGFPAGAQIDLEVCGANGQRGSAGCAIESGRQTVADAGGSFVDAVTVEIPRLPCPCVALATAGSISASAPVTIIGAPFDTSPAPAAESGRGLELLGVDLRGAGPWTAWFGASPRRTIAATIHNPGAVDVRGAELVLTVRSGGEAPTIVAVEDLPDLPPDGTYTYERGFGLGGLAFGSYTVEVQVTGAGEPVSARAATSSYPWGLAVAAVLAVQVVLLVARNRLRRAVHGEPVQSSEPAEPAALDLRPVYGPPEERVFVLGPPEPEGVLDLTEPVAERDAGDIQVRLATLQAMIDELRLELVTTRETATR